MKPLKEINGLIGNREELLRSLEDDGYLFFRQLLKRDNVLRVKSDIIEVLKNYGVVDRDSLEPIWNGNKFSSGKQRIEALSEISSLKSFIDLGNSREIVSVFEGILDDKIFSWTQKTPRVLFPESTYKKNDVMGCSISLHQDVFFYSGIQNFYVTWVPFMDIDKETGGVALAPGSHKNGFNKEDYEYDEENCTPAIPETKHDLEWRRSEYQAGDALVFSSTMIHKGMPNTTNLVRLSADYRYQLQGTEIEWTTKRSVSWFYDYKNKIEEIAAETGADKILQEKIFYVMRKLQLEPKLENVKIAIEELNR